MMLPNRWGGTFALIALAPPEKPRRSSCSWALGAPVYGDGLITPASRLERREFELAAPGLTPCRSVRS